jgi:two-component sensor histidine kinase
MSDGDAADISDGAPAALPSQPAAGPASTPSPQQQLSEERARLAAAVRAGRLGVHEFDPATGKIVWDETVRRYWGLPEGQPDYAFFLSRIHPDDRERTQAAVDASLDPAGSGRYECDYRVTSAVTGEQRWVRADGDVTFEDGQPVRMIGTVKDISHERALEDHNRLLMRELEHRVRNMLTVVQSLAHLGFRSAASPEAARDAFLGRLKALAAGQTDVRSEGVGITDFEALARRVLALVDPMGERIRLVGPSAEVEAQCAQSLTLILHELATNALKHGALSVPAGFVAMQWERIPGAARIRITWRESGGPPVAPPARRGFGTVLINRALPGEDGCGVQMQFAPDGLVCTIIAPVLA